mgnify:CR=1 FL=1
MSWFWTILTIASALLAGLAGYQLDGHAAALIFTIVGGLVSLAMRDLHKQKHAIICGTVLAGLICGYFFGLGLGICAALFALPLQLAIDDFIMKREAKLPLALSAAFAGWTAGWWLMTPVAGLIFALIGFLAVIGIDDYFLQRKHAVLRNYPLIGWFRYGAELIGDELRQYWFMSDTEETPYNRVQRRYIYRSARGLNNNLGFGSDRKQRDVGEIHILNSMFPTSEKREDGNRLRPLVIGAKRRKPYVCPWPIAISGMSWGALSAESVMALSSGAKVANVHMLTGEGGLTPYHTLGVVREVPRSLWVKYYKQLAKHYLSFKLAAKPTVPQGEVVGGGRIIVQLGPAKFGFRRMFMDLIAGTEGRQFRKRFSDELDLEKLKKTFESDQIVAGAIKLAQGAKPGQGGKLPKEKITKQLAEWRGIPEGQDCFSPNAWDEFDVADSELRDPTDQVERMTLHCTKLVRFLNMLQEQTGKPWGIKIVLGQEEQLRILAKVMKETGMGPDFITVDGGEGGTGAAPVALADHVGLPLFHALPEVDNIFRNEGIRDQVVIIGSGLITTGADIAIAIALGADMVNIGRGNLIAQGCIQAKKCHKNTCPIGITTQDPRLRRGFDPYDKYVKNANYNMVLQRELMVVMKACGVRTPWELTRHHLKVVVSPMVERYLDEILPYVDGSNGKRNLVLGDLPDNDPEYLDRFGPKLIQIGLPPKK